MKRRVLCHVPTHVQGIWEINLFRSLPRARKFFRTLRKGSEISRAKESAEPLFGRRDLLGYGHGLHLVLERSALLAAVGGNRLPAQGIRSPRAVGYRRAADAIQGPCLGGSRRPRGQRQTLHARDVRGARPLLKRKGQNRSEGEFR